MKNKKAFTLIELLAVIVVLAIILTITIPIVSNLITSARKASFKSDARLVLDQVRIQKNQDEEFDPTSISYDTLGTYNISNENYESLTVSMVNNKPYIYVVGKNKWSGYKACGTYNNMGVYEVTELGTCQGEGPVTFPKVSDSNPGEICTDYSTDSTCYIKSVEDLVGFSKSAESGKDYLGKTIILVNGLDIKSTKSYVNSNTTSLGDINGDGTTDGLLTELTTGKGFNSIGSDTKQFKGTFEGNTKTIGNLYINRPTQNYVGLFGYNSGIIRGLTITDENISGAAYMGGVAGYNNGTISSIYLNGTITAKGAYIGGIAGVNAASKVVNSVLVNINIDAAGYTVIGGIVGSNAGIVKGITESGNIIAAGGSYSNAGKLIGYNNTGGTFTGYTSSSITLPNGSGYYGVNGTNYDSSLNGDINFYDSATDTWIGGDNDSDGYYFDYDADNNVVVKNKVDNPMTFSLNGTGATDDPYIINNYEQWKQATLKTSGGYTFELKNDIYFTDKKYYAFGSNDNYFSGTFEGNGYTVSNVITKVNINSGLFGYNNGIIRGLNAKNISITGQNYLGGITGYNNGTISSIYINGSIKANGAYVGGITGVNPASKTINAVLVNINIDAAGYTVIGGIVGSNAGIVKGITESGNIIAAGGSYSNAGKLIGSNNTGGTFTGYTSSSITLPNGSGYYGVNGTNYDSSLNGDINFYDSATDTWIGGDNDSDGYYFDYDADNNVVVKNKVDNPMTFSLSGDGSTSDPYIINNYEQWKQATLKTSGGYTFKLNSNINFSGKKYYAFGSNDNYFSGTFEGNGYTISNVITKVNINSGLFGYNNGIIRGLNAENISVSGQNNFGGITGYNNGTISSIYINGSIKANGAYVGGITGVNPASKTINAVLVNINIDATGYTNVGGIAGNNTGIVKGIVESGNIMASSGSYCNAGKLFGYNNTGGTFTGYTSSSITLPNGSGYYGVNGTNYDSSLNGDINFYDSAIDTWIGGDNDSDGYYFDYDADNNVVVKNKVDNPMTFSLSGDGSTSDPYIINNYEQWKQATLKTSGGYTFKLNSNINFSGKKYYAFGSNDNYFSGIFEGYGYTILNVTEKVNVNGGLFGYNNGTIRGLNVENISLAGPDTFGGITGYNNGTISSIYLNGSLKTNGSTAGGIAGYNAASKTINGALVSVNINATGYTTVGGIVGNNAGIVKGITESGNILASSGSYCNAGKLLGYNTGTFTGYTSSSITLPNGSGYYGQNGTNYDSTYNNNLTKYDEYSLDTRIDGDNDSDGYYFDYNSDSSNIIVKSFVREPILILRASQQVVILSEGDSKSIFDYLILNPIGYPGVTVDCKKQNGNIITNVNEIAFGKDTVTCQMHLTNSYGSFTSNLLSINFIYKYLAATTSSCPSGYTMHSGSCTSSSSCATSQPVDIGYACGGLTCATSSDVASAKATFKASATDPDYFLSFNATDTTGCTGTGVSNYACHVEECTAYATASEVTNYSCNRTGVTGTGESATANLKADHYCYFREFSVPEDLISGTTFGSSTGGWRLYYTQSDSGFSSSAGYYTLYASWDNGISTIQTTNKIDLVFYDKITLNVDMSNNNSGRVNTTYVGVYNVDESTATLNFTRSVNATTSSGTAVNKVIVLDVSDLAGLYYIKVAVNQSPGYAYTAASKINGLKIE